MQMENKLPKMSSNIVRNDVTGMNNWRRDVVWREREKSKRISSWVIYRGLTNKSFRLECGADTEVCTSNSVTGVLKATILLKPLPQGPTAVDN
ncbi:hypothetical protein TNIN_218011 [Trichonephila inaurata madagascariensis]|uniref:Uncharacterized protein n=1 Tax=Trichonephila inaurata madagascariensis TaxID=2747483 RepID=A0A8X6XLZ4_9ARAC|nr:hypothetical protein TNIN_218011 [Trichonephila inaurata madagascariensis]